MKAARGKKLRKMLTPFPKGAKLVWCQEEPQSLGAWTFIEPRLRTLFCTEIAYAGREASASPPLARSLAINVSKPDWWPDAFSI